MNQLLVMAALAAGTTVPQLAPPPRDPDADGPPLVAVLSAPLPNFGRVSPGVFRSGQPTPAREGIALARAKGIRSVLNLQLRWHDGERQVAAEEGLFALHVPMNGIYSPTFGQVDRALDILTDPDRLPVLVHCHYGKDRTGVVIAAYRVAIEGWTIADAVAEAKAYTCCHPLFVELHEYLTAYMEHRAKRAD